MPWTTRDPPGPAKNVKSEHVRSACVKAANKALANDKSEAEAIRACIGAMKTAGEGTLFLALPEGMTDEALSTLVSEQGLGFVTLTGEPERFEIEYENGRMMALGAVPSDVDFSQVRALYFHDAILAREETNRNKDRLPPEEIEALAKSIGGMPIDDEHVFDNVCGVFARGKTVKGADGLLATSVDGLIWAQRFPEIAEGLVKGERQLSMEVWIAAATCGMCNETFKHKDEYCAHLEHREAVRTLHGVQGFGGALTIKPAGTETTFDHDSMMVVASHHLASSDHNKTEGANDMELEEKITQLEAERDAAKARVAELEADLQTSTTALDAAKASLLEATEATDALRWSIRKQKLEQAGYDEEKLVADEEVLAAMTDAAFDILVANMDRSTNGGDDGNAALGTVNLGGGADDDKIEIVFPNDPD